MIEAQQPRLILARSLVLRASQLEPPLLDAALLVVDGRVSQVARGSAAARRLARVHDALIEDLGDVALVPGLVNAHAHLELTGMLGVLPRDAGFGAWVGALLRAKVERGLGGMTADAERGLNLALVGGTTTIGDVASVAATLGALGRKAPGPRVRLFREVLDAWDPQRTSAALAIIETALVESASLFEGYSPHAPFTVSRALLDGLAKRRARHPRPVSMHWAETQAELDWMAAGTGDFADVLGPSPCCSGLDLLEAAGLLGPDTSLVHGNLPTADEVDRIAAAGASVVHCPGTHAFFGRDDFPLAAYENAGVNLALGTDSLASTDSLDLVVEARRLLERETGLAPGRVLAMATEGGAQALGLESQIGCLEPGYWADAVAIPLATSGSENSSAHSVVQSIDTVSELLLLCGVPIQDVLIGGRSAKRPPGTQERA